MLNSLSFCVFWHFTVRIQLGDDDNSVLLLKRVMEIEEFLVVQLGQQSHLSQSRLLPLGTGGDEFCSVLHFGRLLLHPFHIGKCTPVVREGESLKNNLKPRRVL